MTTQKRALIALCILGSTMYLAGGITTPSIAYIIDSYPNVSAYTVSSLVTMPGIVALFASFFIGPLVMKFNKKYLLMTSVAITLIYFAIFTLIGGRGPFAMLMVAAGLLGIHRGAGSALVNSIIGEYMPPEKRATSIALSGAIMQAGSGVIAIFAGFIAEGNGGADWPIAHNLGFVSIATLVIFAFLMPKRPDNVLPDVHTSSAVSETSVFKTIKNGFREISPKAYVLMGLNFAFVLFVISFNLYTSVYVISEHELGTSVEAGLVNTLFTMSSILVGLSYVVWSKLFKNWIVPIGYMLSALAFLIKIVFTTHIAGIWIASVILSFGWNLSNPFMSSKIMSLAPQKLIPVAISIHLGFQNLAMFLSPYVLRVVGRLFGGGINGALTSALIAIVICAFAALIMFVRGSKKEAV